MPSKNKLELIENLHYLAHNSSALFMKLPRLTKTLQKLLLIFRVILGKLRSRFEVIDRFSCLFKRMPKHVNTGRIRQQTEQTVIRSCCIDRDTLQSKPIKQFLGHIISL